MSNAPPTATPVTIIGHLNVFYSKRDRGGNCYWAFTYVDAATGKEVNGKISGGESNITGALFGWTTPKEWERGIITNTHEMGVRAWQRMVKDWPYAGCPCKDIRAFIKAQLAK